jgi:hypothetical protein
MLVLYHDWDAFCCINVRFCLVAALPEAKQRIPDPLSI